VWIYYILVNFQSALKRIKLKMNKRRKIAVITFFLAVLVSFGFIVLREKNFTAQNTKTIKILCYNIHYGIGMDSQKNLKRIADVINKLNPDIVGLQEVSDSSMTAILGELTKMNAVFGPSIEKETPNLYRLLNIAVPKSQLFYGDAILSKHPFEYIGNLSIPSASSSRYEAMCADINLSSIYGEDTRVRFVNTHFDYLETISSKVARKGAVEVIEKAFLDGSNTLPAILTGDLNATPHAEPIELLQQNGWVTNTSDKNLLTVPSVNPKKQIDYVMVRPKQQWRIIDVKVIDEPLASDHLPILMTLELFTEK